MMKYLPGVVLVCLALSLPFTECVTPKGPAIRTNGGCHYEGINYPPGTQIGLENDDNTELCTGIVCTADSRVILYTGAECDQTKRTYEDTETRDVQCLYKGQTYSANDIITSHYDDIYSMCYGSYCSASGTVQLYAVLSCSPEEVTSSNLENRKSHDDLKTRSEVSKRIAYVLSRKNRPKSMLLIQKLIEHIKNE